MTPAWRVARPLAGVVILAVLVWRVGVGPFVDGVRVIDGWSLAAAAGIAVVTTVCCAWRWSLVARGLGVGVSLPTAVAAYYRSQFLNTTLPGGVLGDLHRAVRHGREVGDVSRGLRSVAWERGAGQVVQLVIALVVLLLLPSPVRSAMPVVAIAVSVVVAGVVLLIRAAAHDEWRRHRSSRWQRGVRAAAADLRVGLLARPAWPGVAAASVVAVAGNVATFVIAARAAGSTVSPVRMLPLALLVLLAMSVPTNIAGWGPRESVAAWAFSVAGLGAAQGVATAVVYGVMVLVASLPGAGVMIVSWLRRQTGHPGGDELSRGQQPAVGLPSGVVHG